MRIVFLIKSTVLCRDCIWIRTRWIYMYLFLSYKCKESGIHLFACIFLCLQCCRRFCKAPGCWIWNPRTGRFVVWAACYKRQPIHFNDLHIYTPAPGSQWQWSDALHEQAICFWSDFLNNYFRPWLKRVLIVWLALLDTGNICFFLTNDKVESGPAGPLIICCFWVLLEQTSPSTVAWAVGCLCLGSILKVQTKRSCGWRAERCPWRAYKLNAVKFSVWHSLSSDSVAFVFLPPLVAQDTWDGSKAFAPRRDQFGSGCTNFSATRNQILKALKSCF